MLGLYGQLTPVKLVSPTNLKEGYIESFYYCFTLNFGIPQAMVFLLEQLLDGFQIKHLK